MIAKFEDVTLEQLARLLTLVAGDENMFSIKDLTEEVTSRLPGGWVDWNVLTGAGEEEKANPTVKVIEILHLSLPKPNGHNPRFNLTLRTPKRFSIGGMVDGKSEKSPEWVVVNAPQKYMDKVREILEE